MALEFHEAARVAHLARLELSAADLTAITGQLSAILDYVQTLAELPTDGVEPLAHPLPIHSVFRDDEVRPSLPVAAALANAPARLGDFFLVPAILDSAEDESAP